MHPIFRWILIAVASLPFFAISPPALAARSCAEDPAKAQLQSLLVDDQVLQNQYCGASQRAQAGAESDCLACWRRARDAARAYLDGNRAVCESAGREASCAGQAGCTGAAQQGAERVAASEAGLADSLKRAAFREIEACRQTSQELHEGFMADLSSIEKALRDAPTEQDRQAILRGVRVPR